MGSYDLAVKSFEVLSEFSDCPHDRLAFPPSDDVIPFRRGVCSTDKRYYPFFVFLFLGKHYAMSGSACVNLQVKEVLDHVLLHRISQY